ncbi:ABC transporter transmembrane domain-containing protein [Devosia sp. XJ19-1]|uniref:ABC transporter transmembrane domain-containing protein n=1 Tax=Devosia ureilytica TaxID=2952754 RepID=A0A9Q4FU39_9HYPH|nr:ABC transporter transmembrane domain-containing protein [Devosia ureilytica]MCP8884634.1 ABC transporter transmembrane domain-containing protein [Devosia ureilytica]MCP8888264.1 ABC transporter transmembrane domain-containing protein [Devosia ureilytica]
MTDQAVSAATDPEKIVSEVKAAPRQLQPLRRLFPFLLRYPLRLALTVLFLLVSAISSLAIPAVLGGAIDEGFVAQNLDNVGRYGWLIIGISVIMAVASGARFYFISVIGERVVADLRQAVFAHLLQLETRYFDTHRVGELTSRLNGDVTVIRGAVGSSFSLALRSLVTIIGALTMMILTSPVLTIAVVVALPAILFPVMIYARRLRGMSRRTQDALADLSAMATEMLGANRTVKSFTQEHVQAAHYDTSSEASYRAEVKRLGARAFLVGMVIFLGTAALVGLVWWGARAVFDGSVTAGQLGQFLVYALMASGALTNVSEVLGTLQTVSGATERLTEILDTKPEIVDPARPVALPTPPLGTVTFTGVNFSYGEAGSDKVLTNVSFSVGKGETVALVGPSGSGKSTTLSLLQRFYDVDAGTIAVDGVDIRDVKLSELRQRFAYVEQEPIIFAGTIADNIRFGKPDAAMDEVIAAAKAALVDDFVTDLPAGYDTVVGERGVMLSGGQKQRLAIARAILKNAPILLLDEATSALDAQSERLVQLALEHLMEGRTTLVIAHRLATIRDANTILVLDGGEIIDHGTHDQLVAKGGRYADLAKLQFRTAEAV